MTRSKPKNTKLKRTKKGGKKKLHHMQRPGNGKEGYFQDWMVSSATELVGKLGYRNSDLANYFEVNSSTIDYWISHKPEFRRAVKKGRTEAALKVAQSLYLRAIGYTHPDERILSNRVKIYDENGNLIEERTEALRVNTLKHYPPDVTAAVQYLKIMEREIWADVSKVNVNHNYQGEVSIKKIEELSMKDLNEEMRKLIFDINMKQLSVEQSN